MSNFIQTIGRFDQNLFLTVNQSQSVKFNKLLFYVTKLGGLCFQSGLALALLLYPPTRKLGVKLAIAQIAIAIIVQIIKAIVARVRPYNALTGIIPFKAEKDYSFPSGHSAASFATALIISGSLAMSSVFCFSLAACIGFSRIYIGVHYPTDVIAGSLIGLGLSFLLLMF
jgi:undecaprenyl-diphosphatase